jgi:hypothetical protein
MRMVHIKLKFCVCVFLYNKERYGSLCIGYFYEPPLRTRYLYRVKR